MLMSCSEIPHFSFNNFCRSRDFFTDFVSSAALEVGGTVDTVFVDRTSRLLHWTGTGENIHDFEDRKSNLYKLHKI